LSIKVSIIIPVYNAEKYITQCIESLLNQTLTDCEFIFVNDGSKDYSGAIINKYKENDNRIKLVNQINQGVSVARNVGLKVAAGEYIGFVDADDFVEKDMFEFLYKSALKDDCDIIISNFQSNMENHKVISNYEFPKNITLNYDYIQENILPYFLRKDDLNTVCTKIYKNKLIEITGATFPKNIALGEDGMFNIQCFNKARKVQFINYIGYHYRDVDGSATRNTANVDYFKRALDVYTSELPTLFNALDNETIMSYKSIKLINNVMAYLYIYFKPNKEQSFIKRYRYIKNMVSNDYVREALSYFINEKYQTLGRYEKFLIGMVKRKSTMGLYFATTYSRLRNK
jgi:glycosyltransferase involved in cell wall biosynthesis